MTPISMGGLLALQLGGFVDVGWFDTTGTGASYRPVAARSDQVWSYTGDPWAATVNSQGDPADLGNTFNNVVREDGIASGGAPTFLVNTVEAAAVVRGPNLDADLALWVEPRDQTRMSLDRAYLTWHPGEGRGVEVHLGQIESSFGVEWYRRRAPQRPGITPSLIARYTTGTPLGVSVLGRLPGDRIRLLGALTNGGTATRSLDHFSEAGLDSNGVPTFTGRVEAEPGGSSPALTLGASGQVGAQDGLATPVPMFQVGGDLAVHGRLVYAHAEYLLTDQDQGRRGEVDRLRAHGGYLQVWGTPRWTPWLSPLLRLDRRVGTMEITDAAGLQNRYRSDVVRVTAGVRSELARTGHVAARVEVAHLWELVGRPIDDDILTTSLLAYF